MKCGKTFAFLLLITCAMAPLMASQSPTLCFYLDKEGRKVARITPDLLSMSEEHDKKPWIEGIGFNKDKQE